MPSGADQEMENPQKSILEAAKARGLSKESIKTYRVCGGSKDPHREWDINDPLCQLWDYGASPLEVVRNSILQSNTL